MVKRAPRKGEGRPSIYTKKLGDSVCEGISNGWSVRTVCAEDAMPGLTTVFKWIRELPEFAKQYAQACEERTEAHNESLLEMGEEAIEKAQDVDPKAAGAVVSAYKLKADNLKWSMSKMKPKKYGDKLDMTTNGKDLPQPLLHVLRNNSDAENSGPDQKA